MYFLLNWWSLTRIRGHPSFSSFSQEYTEYFLSGPPSPPQKSTQQLGKMMIIFWWPWWGVPRVMVDITKGWSQPCPWPITFFMYSYIGFLCTALGWPLANTNNSEKSKSGSAIVFMNERAELGVDRCARNSNCARFEFGAADHHFLWFGKAYTGSWPPPPLATLCTLVKMMKMMDDP